MIGKPFQPPLLTRIKKVVASDAPVSGDVYEPQAKRRKTSIDREQHSVPKRAHLVFKTPGVSSLPRKPLVAIENTAVAALAAQSLDREFEGYYSVLW